MIKIGLIKEGKIPADSRVALIPAQCKWMMQHFPDIAIVVQSSSNRCFSDDEYRRAGIKVTEDVTDCDILLGIKEVPKADLIPNKVYLFFSHTRKKQPYNRALFHEMINKKITLIDYECLEHEDGQRIIGFGFFAGIVGAHNGMMCYGKRTGLFHLGRVYEVMNLLGVTEVEPDEYLEKKFTYPVYVQLKGADLFTHKYLKTYQREHFHTNAKDYRSRFLPYAHCTDILMNGIFWTEEMPRLFELTDIDEHFAIQTISDITDDAHGSVPINLGDQTIEDPVYGVDRVSFTKTKPYLPDSIDVIAVGNLPNELSRDASRYFGEQLMKHVLPDLLSSGSNMIERATILKNGQLTQAFSYLSDYAAG